MSNDYTELEHYFNSQTDILGYRTFPLKINKLPTFSEITQEWQYLKLVIHTEFQLPIISNLRYRLPTPNYIDLYWALHAKFINR